MNGDMLLMLGQAIIDQPVNEQVNEVNQLSRERLIELAARYKSALVSISAVVNCYNSDNARAAKFIADAALL